MDTEPMLTSPYRGAPSGLRSHPSNLIRLVPAKGVQRWQGL